MEVAIPGSNNGGSPFQREVREWQRIDPNTGALLTGRLEADRWINGSLNSYGKVVDSQNVSQPNGTQHSQRKQLEVLQARTSSGSMQVIRAHTVQTTSSRWTATSSSSASSSKSSSPLMTSLTGGYLSNHPQRFHANVLTNEPADSGGNNEPTADRDHLTSNFHLNSHPKQQQQSQHRLFSTAPSLKLSNLMKSTSSVTNGTCVVQNKASLHKSNNISSASHRPSQRHHHFLTSTSRQKQKTDSATAATILQQTSSSSSMSSTSTSSNNRKSTTDSFRYDNSRYDLPTTDAYVGGVDSSNGGGRIIDICSRDIDDVGDDDDNGNNRVNSSPSRRQQETTWQSTLQRGRSVSTDDLTSNGNAITNAYGDGDGDDEPAEWRRVSKIRRSFQFPSTTASELLPTVSRSRPTDLPERSVNVSRIRAELENGRRLSTAMRNNHVDLVALDSILNAGSTSGSGTASPLTTKKKTTSFLTAESLKEIRGKLKKLSDESLYKDDFVTKKDDNRGDAHEVTSQTEFQYTPRSNGSLHTTNSLESRSVKSKDTSSVEWHLRRKSYGFEKMSPPDDKSMFRFENSTDSGLGRSSDLGNWSPTADSANPSTRATVITFGDQDKISNLESKVRPLVQRRLRNRTQPQSEAESAEMKRHSIAVDESHYVRENLRKTSAVHLNGFYSKDTSPQNSGFSDDNSRRQKRVEFCKTEVHFAAESGRVNIVETDGKPPPSNNFRRRRRSSSTSSTQDSSKKSIPMIHFGDERKLNFDVSVDVDDEQGEEKSTTSNVTVSIPINLERAFDSESRDGDDHQDEISIRGILKNKPIKPKPYHLGENIDSADALWGVQLKPVGQRSFSAERDQTEEDFKEATVSPKSVAERVRIVEERKEGAGYSTKINLSLSNSPYEWTDPEVPQSNIMNIELHSPLATTIKKPESIRMQPPVAKPRTLTAKQNTIHKQQERNPSPMKSVNSVAPLLSAEATEHLKIVKEARGARKLREHELSYFGVKVSSDENTDSRPAITPSKNKLSTTSKRSLPSRKLSTSSKEDPRLSNKWSLPNDKPDLLRHSPILVEPHVITKTAIVAPSIGTQRHRSRSPIDSSDDQIDGLYENIKKPSASYCRQKDLERDEMILSEMTRTADQTLKAVSDEAAQKDLRRRSISRRLSKPLETIDEKFTKPISKTVTRSKTSTNRIARESSNRPSSASSGDSMPSTPTRLKSRSRQQENSDYVNVKTKSSSRPIIHRSSSRESQRSATSSTEDIAHKNEVIRKSKRSTTKDEPALVRHHASTQQRSLRSSTESNERRKVTPRSSIRDRVDSRDPQQCRLHRPTKSDVEQKRISHTSTVDSKSGTKTSRSRLENEKTSKSTTERVPRSKAYSSNSTSEHQHNPHRSTGSKSATMSSTGNNSDILIPSKSVNSSATHSSSSKTATKRSSKTRK